MIYDGFLWFLYYGSSLIVGSLAYMGMWLVLEKAEKPGWYALIPILNLIMLCRIAGVSSWWVFLLLVPVVGAIVLMFMVSVRLAETFEFGTGFGIGLALLPFVFYPILGLNDRSYYRVERFNY
jgi:hypothetical protein